jgi:N-acetyl-anhydromuramyl-L-alanine amidase AmpD
MTRATMIPRLGVALLSALSLGSALGCSPSTESTPDVAHGRAELAGDSPLVEDFRAAEREHGVPAELLATIGFVQTRLSMTAHDDEHAGHAHAPREWGLMAIGTGGLMTLEQAAAASRLSVDRIASDPESNVRAAAALLAAEAERQGLEPRADSGWAPVLAAYGGDALRDEVLELLGSGWHGTDDAGFSVEVRGHGATDTLRTVQQALGYPGAKWSAAYSGNYQAASRGAGQINYIVIHTVQGSYSGCISWFKNSSANVTAHYVVRSSDGEITQMVDDSDIAWHDACFNSETIGIEHEGYVSDPGKWYTQAMYESSAKLTRWLADQYGIPLDKAHIMGHGEAPDCSDHTDPGSGWDWNKYMDLVKNGACSPKPEVCNAKDDDCDGSTDEGDVCVLAELVVPQMGALDTVSSDLDGDGTADVCARSSAGITCYKAGSGGFPDAVPGPELSNDQGWGAPEYYATIRMAEINGDGKADICARSSAGVHCWLGDGSGFPEQIDGPAWSDANGWGAVKFWSTLRFADIDGDGKSDVCARAAAGIVCHKSTGSGFGDAITGPELSDASGWSSERYFATLRTADVNGDGKADLCARHSAGFSCWLSDGNGFPTEVIGPELSDAKGWDAPKHWATIRMGDVNGDGKADVCARAAAGFSCWLSDGTGFPTPMAGPELSDASGWGDVSYWSTLRLSDMNGDGKADVCARAAAGFHCWLSTGSGFGDAIVGPDMTDAGGWNQPHYYGTFRIADVTGDGKADVCGRGYSGIVCWPFDGTAFGEKLAGPEWSNANGWDKVQYYSTLQAAGGCYANAEVCNGKDDDCDGESDEGDVCASGGAGGGSGGSWGGSGGNGQGGAGNGTNADPDGAASDDGGCGCRATRSSPTAGWAGLLGLLALGLCRRRR